MSTPVIELYDALKAAGVDEDRARAAANAVLASEAKDLLATKADLADFKAATKADIADLRAAMKVDFAELRTDLAERLANQQRFLLQMMLGMTAIFATIVGLLRVFA